MNDLTKGTRRGQTRVGVLGFVAVTLVVLAALVVFARYPSIFRSGHDYRAVFGNVAGLNVGDEVRYGGLGVGVVTRMEIAPRDPAHIAVTFRVKNGTPVRVDTRASITQIGFVGEEYLLLEAGRPDAPPLPPGGTVPTMANLSFQDAMTRLATFFDRADTLLSGAERFARSSPLDRVDTTLGRLDSLVASTTRGSTRVFANLDTTTRRVDELLNRSARAIALIDTALSRSGPQLATTQEEALHTIRDLRAMLTDLRDALQQGGGVANLVRNMSIASENLARVTERLDRDPSSILKRRAAPDKIAGPSVRQ